MYANPVLLPQFSNREDLLLTVSIFDDDTGTAVDLDGVTLVNPNGFTGAAWTVTDGAIITTSATSFTIPGFPLGNQLSALAITVGAGLGIVAGDPITIKDTPTGLNSVTGYVVSYASSTGKLVVQIGMTFQFEIRRGRMGAGPDFDGYSTSFGLGVVSDQAPLLSASLGNGITITDLGFIQILIAESTFRQLCETGTYKAALTMSDSVTTRQIMIAQLPVLAGGVTQ